MASIYYKFHRSLFTTLKQIDGLPALALRLYLVPVFWMAGSNKLNNMDSTIEWFGNAEWGLGLPFPTVMAYLATYTEVVGAILLLCGFAVRWISIPLMATMAIAALSVHWENGWPAIADSNVDGVAERLATAKNLLREYGNYNSLTEKGGFVILNNGIEFAATYFIMLFALFFSGGGRYFSVDYWLNQHFNRKL
ncbi:MAG: DoxX family protein [Pseudomonadales bacterium]